jgi:hypothetical protein
MATVVNSTSSIAAQLVHGPVCPPTRKKVIAVQG